MPSSLIEKTSFRLLQLDWLSPDRLGYEAGTLFQSFASNVSDSLVRITQSILQLAATLSRHLIAADFVCHDRRDSSAVLTCNQVPDRNANNFILDESSIVAEISTVVAWVVLHR